MKLPRDVSGDDLIQVRCKHYGYHRVNQVGSHVILETPRPAHHRLSVPQHASLILRSVAETQGLDKRDIVAHL